MTSSHPATLPPQAFDGARDDYYTGINAAAKSVLLGTEQISLERSEYAPSGSRNRRHQPKAGDYSATATIGEVFLMQKNFRRPAALRAAVAGARAEIGSHKTTWKQACRLMEKLHPTPKNGRWFASRSRTCRTATNCRVANGEAVRSPVSSTKKFHSLERAKCLLKIRRQRRFKSRHSPLRGCVKPSRQACNICRG